MELEKQINRFYKNCQSIDRMYEEYAKATGLTYMSSTVLGIIYDYPENCTQKLICEETHFPKQSVNMIIKSFLEQGYVELNEIPSDRRNKQINLSEEGKIYADKIIGKLRKAEYNAMEALTFEQREHLINLIEIYEKSFQNNIANLIIDSNQKE